MRTPFAYQSDARTGKLNASNDHTVTWTRFDRGKFSIRTFKPPFVVSSGEKTQSRSNKLSVNAPWFVGSTRVRSVYPRFSPLPVKVTRFVPTMRTVAFVCGLVAEEMFELIKNDVKPG